MTSLFGLARPLATRIGEILAAHHGSFSTVAELLWREALAPAARRRFASALGITEAAAEAWVTFLAGLHDLGKLSPDLQLGRCPAGSPLQGVSDRLASAGLRFTAGLRGSDLIVDYRGGQVWTEGEYLVWSEGGSIQKERMADLVVYGGPWRIKKGTETLLTLDGADDGAMNTYGGRFNQAMLATTRHRQTVQPTSMKTDWSSVTAKVVESQVRCQVKTDDSAKHHVEQVVKTYKDGSIWSSGTNRAQRSFKRDAQRMAKKGFAVVSQSTDSWKRQLTVTYGKM